MAKLGTHGVKLLAEAWGSCFDGQDWEGDLAICDVDFVDLYGVLVGWRRGWRWEQHCAIVMYLHRLNGLRTFVCKECEV
jgi:hypothetical protein